MSCKPSAGDAAEDTNGPICTSLADCFHLRSWTWRMVTLLRYTRNRLAVAEWWSSVRSGVDGLAGDAQTWMLRRGSGTSGYRPPLTTAYASHDLDGEGPVLVWGATASNRVALFASFCSNTWRMDLAYFLSTLRSPMRLVSICIISISGSQLINPASLGENHRAQGVILKHQLSGMMQISMTRSNPGCSLYDGHSDGTCEYLSKPASCETNAAPRRNPVEKLFIPHCRLGPFGIMFRFRLSFPLLVSLLQFLLLHRPVISLLLFGLLRGAHTKRPRDESPGHSSLLLWPRARPRRAACITSPARRIWVGRIHSTP